MRNNLNEGGTKREEFYRDPPHCSVTVSRRQARSTPLAGGAAAVALPQNLRDLTQTEGMRVRLRKARESLRRHARAASPLLRAAVNPEHPSIAVGALVPMTQSTSGRPRPGLPYRLRGQSMTWPADAAGQARPFHP